MTRGCRAGKVLKKHLHERLSAVHAPGALPSEEAPLNELLGHAINDKLLSEHEIRETCPRTETTLACYLRPRIHHMPDGFAQRLEDYVQAASVLFRRGSLIANRIAMDICGPKVDASDDGSRQRFCLHSALEDTADFRAFVIPEDARNAVFKQVFLPERWPTATVPRDPVVSAILERYAATLPPLPAWQQIMGASGWDNSINRMATKYSGNIQVLVCTNLARRVRSYIQSVRLDGVVSRSAIEEATVGCLRPLAVSDEDFKMIMDLRTALGASSTSDYPLEYPPSKTPWTMEALALHIFLVRYGAADYSYLPIAARGRKYCYVDCKIATALLSMVKKQIPSKTAAAKGGGRRRKEPEDAGGPSGSNGGGPVEDGESSMSVGDLLGLNPENFAAQNRHIRRDVRRRLRAARHAEVPAERRRRKERLKHRAMMMSVGRMHKDARVDSFETDGVGLRLCLKIPVEIASHVKPLPTEAPVDSCKSTRRGKKREREEDEPQVADWLPKGNWPSPIMVGVDEGRAKLMAAAISQHPLRKPKTSVFTRKHYYAAMGYWRQQKWSQARGQSNEVQAALNALSSAGGLQNCDPARWDATMEAERDHHEVLYREYVENPEYAVWRMRLFRKKRSALDRACHDLIREAVRGEPRERPVLIGVGDASFAPTGRGEMAVPTTMLGVALKRAIKRARENGRHVEMRKIGEFRTTMCCSACGAVTQPAMVGEGDARRRSRRLRLCTECETTGKLRDRDVQAARNMLWLLQHEYYGAARPCHLSREEKKKKKRKSEQT